MIASELISYLIVGALGFISGFVWRLGTLKIHGKEVVLPFIGANSRNFTLVAIVLALLSLFTIVQVDRSNTENTRCQVEFQAVLKYNADITTQERPLNERRDKAQFDSNQALTDFVHLLLTPGVDVRAELKVLDDKENCCPERNQSGGEGAQGTHRVPSPLPGTALRQCKMKIPRLLIARGRGIFLCPFQVSMILSQIMQ